MNEVPNSDTTLAEHFLSRSCIAEIHAKMLWWRFPRIVVVDIWHFTEKIPDNERSIPVECLCMTLLHCRCKDISQAESILLCVYLMHFGSWWNHDDVIKWKHFPRYWPFVRGIHRSPVNSPHKGQWRRALMFPLICAWINGCTNNREAGDLRRIALIMTAP